MVHIPLRSAEDELYRERDRATAAWHHARARTFERWLEKSHDQIVRLPGFVGIAWPSADTGTVIRMETERACQEVRVLLASADLTEFDDEPTIDVRLG
jgi:hypothetical protein